MTEGLDEAVATAVNRLRDRRVEDQWAACAKLWTQLWVLGSAGWAKWPETARRVFDGLQLALTRAGGLPDERSAELVLLGLETIDVEDDGSPEWQYMIDLSAVLTEALGNRDSHEAVEVTIRTYLEGAFNVLANDVAVQSGKAVSQSVAVEAIARNATWDGAVALVNAL